ncbi:MAG: acetyl-CoA C-acyltransferase [Acidobacteriota bacterium]|nr:acetyl-CoA C-acyltransferase [Acidobacteriota bacterium]
MPEAVLVSAVRTPIGRAPKGALSTTRPDDLAALVVGKVLDRVPALDKSEIDDVILGCAQPEGEQGWNVARWAALRAGLPVEIPGATVNRLCASGLEAIALADLRIRSGGGRMVVAGGVESMSLIPMGGLKPSPNPWLVEHYPASLLTMGLTAERVARRYGVSREEQDAFALASHQKALAAQAAGRFSGELIPVTVATAVPGTKAGKPVVTERIFATDEGPRADTSAEALAKLKPAFHAQGTVTAGNASQTSDGAAAAVVMDAGRAQELGIRPLARLVAYAVTGCLPEEMGMGPVTAVPKALRLAGLTLADIGLIELNEAFAAQALAVIRELSLDPEIVNVNGGAIALGHPLGCTGAKLTATLLAEMSRRQLRYGMVTMCVGGGMGAAGIFERLS